MQETSHGEMVSLRVNSKQRGEELKDGGWVVGGGGQNRERDRDRERDGGREL